MTPAEYDKLTALLFLWQDKLAHCRTIVPDGERAGGYLAGLTQALQTAQSDLPTQIAPLTPSRYLTQLAQLN
jgi:hypothetical protein